MLKLCCTGMKNLIFLLVFSLFTIARCMWESRTASIKKLAHKRKFRMKYTETMAKNQRIQRLLHSWSTICLQFACRNEIISVYNILCTVLYTLCHILWKKSTFFFLKFFFRSRFSPCTKLERQTTVQQNEETAVLHKLTVFHDDRIHWN